MDGVWCLWMTLWRVMVFGGPKHCGSIYIFLVIEEQNTTCSWYMARKHMTCYVQYWSNTPRASINEIQEFLFSVRPNVLTRRYANIKVVNEILCKTGFGMFKINLEIFLTFFEDIKNTRIKHTVKHTFKNFIA